MVRPENLHHHLNEVVRSNSLEGPSGNSGSSSSSYSANESARAAKKMSAASLVARKISATSNHSQNSDDISQPSIVKEQFR